MPSKRRLRKPSMQELQDNKTAFGRWRLRCPYGRWACADGREVLFNRYYCPIYERYPGQSARDADPNEWVPWKKQEWFFNDGNAPVSYWGIPRRNWQLVIPKIDAVLTDWGLAPLPPRPRRPSR